MKKILIYVFATLFCNTVFGQTSFIKGVNPDRSITLIEVDTSDPNYENTKKYIGQKGITKTFLVPNDGNGVPYGGTTLYGNVYFENKLFEFKKIKVLEDTTKVSMVYVDKVVTLLVVYPSDPNYEKTQKYIGQKGKTKTYLQINKDQMSLYGEISFGRKTFNFKMVKVQEN